MPTRQVLVSLPRPLLDDVADRWRNWPLSEVIGHALMLALAWHDHGRTDDGKAHAEEAEN